MAMVMLLAGFCQFPSSSRSKSLGASRSHAAVLATTCHPAPASASASRVAAHGPPPRATIRALPADHHHSLHQGDEGERGRDRD
ncbi:Os01g0352300 [Oryza sativa Japonica Group]|uniref:Os01g0352300 protein n=1 Tax=Oryza sativa subsp. japonica TaxID=39947 RepID=A0A0P0V2E4_ORYSJ|nr:Os01g0352300 [Oryza sativa Japonica Group]